MQDESRTRREPASHADFGASARHALSPSIRARESLGRASRLAIVLAVLVSLVVPLQGTQPVAFATHTGVTQTSTQTPTLVPSGQGQSAANPWATPTPTLYGYNQYEPAQGQTQYPGSAGQVVPAVPNGSVAGPSGQQGVSAPAYSGIPDPAAAQGPVGLPGSVIVSGAASPGPGGSDVCFGDELITFSPEAPRIGNELLIAVTSARPHPYGRLAGTEPTQFVRERPGQRGYVWEWTVQPSYPGQHEYTFYVDSTVPCQKVQLRVLPSLATATPKPTKTPMPYNWNENSNGNNNSNNNDNFSFATSVAFAPVVDPSFYVFPGQDLYNCSTFESQSNAQRVLRYDPSDPNNLDVEDGAADGIACFSWAYPIYPNDRDVSPVARTTQTPTQTVIPTTTVTQAPTQTPTQTLTPTMVPFSPQNYLGQGDRYGCRDFASHAQAQAVLRADPTDPNRLDTNPRDGTACGGMEAAADGVPGGFMPAPFDSVRVPRP
jgi:hypothetical protein